MEPLLVIGAAVAVAVLWAVAGRRRRQRSRTGSDALAGVAGAGVPLVLADPDEEGEPPEATLRADEEELELAEGALDPDELENDPLHWDEGADDEVG